MSAYTADIQKLYVAYFNRPADVSGLAFWDNAVSTAKDPQAVLAMISAQFATSAEYKATFAGMNEMQTVATVYSNLFSREADMDGLLFWTARLMAHDVTVDTVVAAMAAGAQGADVTTLNNKITAATEFTKALDTPAEAIGYAGDAANAAAKAWLTTVTDDASLATAINADALSSTIGSVIDNGAVTGTTYAMVTGLDTFTGTASNDKIIGAIDANLGSAVNTADSLDSIDGGSGKDTLVLAAKTALDNTSFPTIKNIEIVELQGADTITVNTTEFAGVTNLNVTKAAKSVDVTAAGTTDISVKAIVKDTIETHGGKNVTIAATGMDDALHTITVAGAKGAVNVASTGAAVKAGGATLGAIEITGGSTITVNQKATSDDSFAVSDTATVGGTTVQQGAITVHSTANTTTVVVKQDADVGAEQAVAVVAEKTEVATVKFTALTAHNTVEVGGLTFTAAVDMTAAQVAAAFAGIINGLLPVAGDTQAGGAASKGSYSGEIAGWTSGAANGDTVVFTAAKAGVMADLATTTPTIAGVTKTVEGADADGADGVLGVATGIVTVDDATHTIKSLTVNGYAATSGITGSTALESLSLSNSDNSFTVGDSADILNLTVQGMGSLANAVVDLGATAPTTLNVKNVGTNFINFTDTGTENLNVSGSGTLRAEGGSFASVKSIKVTETAGLRLAAGAAATIVSVDTTGTTGSTTLTIDGSKATYAGGAGTDSVTVNTTAALTKAIDLGAGNDTLTFGIAVTGSTATLSGGDGTDTLSMSAAIADSLDGAAQSFYTNFERLSVGKFGAANTTAETLTLNLANLGFTNYVTTAGTAEAGDVLTLDKLASGATVVLTANGEIVANINGAADATADVLNATVTSSATDLNAGTLTAAKVETINLAVNDTNLDNNFDGVKDPSELQHDSLKLVADSATSVKITGNAHFNLNLTGSTKVTTVDGSAMTGDFVVTAVNTTDATTITGGAGNDMLTAATGTTADVLIGGAGSDTLVANAGLDVLTGGAGNDLFVISQPSLNSSSYATITDFAKGDLIEFANATGFKAAKIAQADTAVFQDYANAAINAVNAGELAWFQYNGNTYIVMDGGAGPGAGDTTFTNNTDLIVKLTGLVDLSGASFNVDYGTVALV